jgi:hypothetical protein
MIQPGYWITPEQIEQLKRKTAPEAIQELNRLDLSQLQGLAYRLNKEGVDRIRKTAYQDRAAVISTIIAATHPRTQICYPADVPAATQESFL